MKPQRINNLQENLLAPRISSLIDPKNPLKVLADPIDWSAFEKAFDSFYSKGKGQPPKPTLSWVGNSGLLIQPFYFPLSFVG